MPDTILLTMDDLEAAVRANAALEEDGEKTVLVAAVDDAVAAVKRSKPNIIILTGALHERRARELAALAKERSIPTLGLVEETEPDTQAVVSRLGLTGWLTKPVEAPQVLASSQRLISRRRLQ